MESNSPSLISLERIQTTIKKDRIEEGEEDHEQPLSPVARFFHDPGPNVYMIFIIGMKTLTNVDLVKANLVHVMEKNHRFSSLQVMEKETGNIRWVSSLLNIDNHVIVPELDPNMELSDKFIEDYASNLSKSHIDNSKPLWDLHILNRKTSDVQSTCVFRIHHSLGDGLSIMNLVLACSCKASDPEALPTLYGDKLASRHIRVTSFRSVFLVLWNSLVALVMLILTLLFVKDTETRLKGSTLGQESRPRRFFLRNVSLNDIKMVKKAVDGTVNDVLLGVVEAGLYRYLNRRYGEKNNVPKNVRVRAMIAVNLRASTHVDIFSDTSGRGTWGNKVGCVLVPFNMRPREDALDYVRKAKIIMARKKASLEAFFTRFFTGLFMKLFGVKVAIKMCCIVDSRTTLFFSNIPGPQEEILFCGHKASYLALSCYGQNTALLVHVVSYADKVTFAISVDEETITDPEMLCDDLLQSLHLMKTSVLVTESVV